MRNTDRRRDEHDEAAFASLIAEVRRLHVQAVTLELVMQERADALATLAREKQANERLIDTAYARRDEFIRLNREARRVLAEAFRVLRDVLKVHSNMGVSVDWLHAEIAAVLAQEKGEAR